jgi:dTDP-4-dehydrorhamnose reductase
LETEVELLLKEKKLTYVASDQEVDITNPDDLHAFSADKPISWIINCAAYTAVDKAEDEQDLAFKLNTDGPLNIATVAKDKCAKLIHISTDYVFDGTKQSAYCETDAPYPVTAYGKSKYRGEVHIQKTLREHFILRTAWLYGKHGNNFVYTMLRLFKERDEISVVNDQYGSPTYAPDLAAEIFEIIHLNADAYGIYHFTNEGKISWHDFACEIYRMAREKKFLAKEVIIQRIATEEYPTKTQRPQNSLLSKDKIIKTFNASPRNWEIALNEFMLDM